MLRAAIVALTALALPSAGASAAPTCDGPVKAASYQAPTDRYPHGVLGDALEWGSLRFECGSRAADIILPDELVFEDVAPRLTDLNGDSAPEIVVVESHRNRGARMAVWGLANGEPVRLAATPFIGTRFRWLAPVGAADLDGDGAVEIAYVDRPHLAKRLSVWRYEGGALKEIASSTGFTNHRIGERDIAGGIRHCNGAPEMVVASANWQRIQVVRLTGGTLVARDIGQHEGRNSFANAMACR